MASTPSPPAAPNPVATAQAQTGENIGTAIANAELSHVDQTDQFGDTTNWNITGYIPYSDPLSGNSTTPQGMIPASQFGIGPNGQSTGSSTYQPPASTSTASKSPAVAGEGPGYWTTPSGTFGNSQPQWISTAGSGGGSGGSYSTGAASSGAGGSEYYIPQYSETTTLSPAEQNIYNEYQTAQSNAGQIADTLSSQAENTLSKPIDLSANNVNNFINTQWEQPFNQLEGQQQEQLNQGLADQGINVNDPAYKTAQYQFGQQVQGQQDTYDTAMYGQGVNALETQYNQPLNEISSLLSNTQINPATFQSTPQTNIPTTDYAGIVNSSYQDQLASYNAQLAQSSATMGGLFGLGGSLISGLGQSGIGGGLLGGAATGAML